MVIDGAGRLHRHVGSARKCSFPFNSTLSCFRIIVRSDTVNLTRFTPFLVSADAPSSSFGASPGRSGGNTIQLHQSYQKGGSSLCC